MDKMALCHQTGASQNLNCLIAVTVAENREKKTGNFKSCSKQKLFGLNRIKKEGGEKLKISSLALNRNFVASTETL